jgi:hypothetical protein
MYTAVAQATNSYISYKKDEQGEYEITDNILNRLDIYLYFCISVGKLGGDQINKFVYFANELLSMK